MNRQQKRALKKEMGAEKVENLNQKISQIFNMPQKCCACAEPFEKKDKEMVHTWSVVVRQETVRLFCPECIKKTQTALEKQEGHNDS
mgnify:CR=1 FL=1|tara:strand:+ start:9734 stop:9994 length:261 start_codon:yes stop_codon:yes gene_type:complete